MFYRLEVPVFHWFARTSPDAAEATPAYYFRAIPTQPEVREKVLRSIGPILISLGLCYREAGMSDHLAALLLLLREAPQGAIPQNVLEHLGL